MSLEDREKYQGVRTPGSQLRVISESSGSHLGVVWEPSGSRLGAILITSMRRLYYHNAPDFAKSVFETQYQNSKVRDRVSRKAKKKIKKKKQEPQTQNENFKKKKQKK